MSPTSQEQLPSQKNLEDLVLVTGQVEKRNLALKVNQMTLPVSNHF